MNFVSISSRSQLPSVCLLHGKPLHNCSSCIWWLLGRDQVRKVKEEEALKLKDEYIKRSASASYGYLLAVDKGQTVGLVQFGPKREFKYLEDLKKGSTDSDKWIVVCLQSKNSDQSVKVSLLNEMINNIKRFHPEVEQVMASVLQNSEIK